MDLIQKKRVRNRIACSVILVCGVVAGGVFDLNADAQAQSGSAKKLPTVPEGKYKGKHAVVETPDYTAEMDENGHLTVQPMEDGEAVGKSFPWYIRFYYRNKKLRRREGRGIVRFENPPKPARNPDEINLKGVLKQGVTFEMKFEFDRDRIAVSAGWEDPDDIKYATYLRMRVQIPPSHDIPPHVRQAKREEMLDGYVVETEEEVEGRSKDFAYPYYDFLHSHGPVEELIIKGPYGGRAVKFEPDRKAKGQMRTWIYHNFCAWQGFRIYYTGQRSENDIRYNEVSVTIEDK